MRPPVQSTATLKSVEPHRHGAAASGGVPRGQPFDAELRLYQRILDRDELALLECLDRIGDLVYCTALLSAGSPAVAEDLTDALFLDLWREPESFHPAQGPFALQLICRLARALAAVPRRRVTARA